MRLVFLRERFSSNCYAVSVVIGIVLMLGIAATAATGVHFYINEMNTATAESSEVSSLRVVQRDDDLLIVSEEDDLTTGNFYLDINGEHITLDHEQLAKGNVIDIPTLIAEKEIPVNADNEYTVNLVVQNSVKNQLKGRYTFQQSIVTQNQPPLQPSQPSPDHHASAIAIDGDLTWEGGDPDSGDSVTYDIYFGTEHPPTLQMSHGSETTYDPGILSYSTVYYWQIISWDTELASTEGDIWSFTTQAEPVVNSPPESPTDPKPTHDAVDVSCTPTLQVVVSDPDENDLTVTFYNAASSMIIESQSHIASGSVVTALWPELAYHTTYTWYVVADDGEVSTTSPLWSFTTIEQPNQPPIMPSHPLPTDGQENVDPKTQLVWTGGDPDPGDTVTYDLYIGTTPDPPLVASKLQDTAYDPLEDFEDGITYYWRVHATDSDLGSDGPLWSFTTKGVASPPDLGFLH